MSDICYGCGKECPHHSVDFVECRRCGILHCAECFCAHCERYIHELESRVAKLEKADAFLDEALNSGDGVYRP